MNSCDFMVDMDRYSDRQFEPNYSFCIYFLTYFMRKYLCCKVNLPYVLQFKNYFTFSDVPFLVYGTMTLSSILTYAYIYFKALFVYYKFYIVLHIFICTSHFILFCFCFLQ